MRKIFDRIEERFGIKPDRTAADIAFGSSDTLVWLTLKRQTLHFVPVFDNGDELSDPSRILTLHGTMRKTAITARAAKRCGTHGALTPIQNETRRAGDHADTGPEVQTVEVAR